METRNHIPEELVLVPPETGGVWAAPWGAEFYAACESGWQDTCAGMRSYRDDRG